MGPLVPKLSTSENIVNEGKARRGREWKREREKDENIRRARAKTWFSSELPK